MKGGGLPVQIGGSIGPAHKLSPNRRWHGGEETVSALRCLPHYPCPVYGASDLLWNSNPYNVKVVQDLNLIKSNPPSWSARTNMSSLWLNLPLSWGMKSWLASVWVEQCWWVRYPRCSWGADLSSQEGEGGGQCVELQVDCSWRASEVFWRSLVMVSLHSLVWGALLKTGDNCLVDIPCLPDPSILWQPDLKYHKIEQGQTIKRAHLPTFSLPAKSTRNSFPLNWWKSLLSSSLLPFSSML